MTAIRLAFDPELQHLLLSDDLIGRLRSLGTVSTQTSTDDQQDGRHLARAYDVVLTSWGSPRLPDTVQRGDRLRFVSHTAGSVRPVVPQQLLAQGVRASQAAAAMAEPVAEFALAMTLSLIRHLHRYDRAIRDGSAWRADATPTYGRSLAHLRVGVIGASRVGRAYIRFLHGLGVTTIRVFDPYLTPADAAAMRVTTEPLERVLATSDVLAIHAPVTPETRQILDAQALRLLPDGAVLINTARAAIIDETALIEQVQAGRLSVGLDVFDEEPLPADHPLVGHPNALLSPHRAGATLDSRRQQGVIAVEEVERFLSGRSLQHEVTAQDYDRLA